MDKSHPRPVTVMDPTAWTVAEVYAQSAMQVCQSVGQCEQFQQELEQLQTIVDQVPDFARLMSASLLPGREKVEIVRRVFDGKVMPELDGLLTVLAKHDRLGLIPVIASRFDQLVHLRRGIVDVVLTTAVPLDDGQVQNLKTQLQELLGSEVMLDIRVDDRIVGGVIVRVGDKLIDASVRSRLEAIRKSLLQRKVSAAASA